MSISNLDRALAQLVLRHPFYACIAMQRPVVRVDTETMVRMTATPTQPGIPTYAATDGMSVYINTDLFEELSREQAVGLLQHEVEHIARMHSWRRQARDPRLWSVACDHVINLSILEHGGALPDGGCHDAKFKGMHEEQVYNLLQQDGEGADKKSGDGEPDMDVLLPSPQGTTSTDMQAIKELVTQAANSAKAKGNLPGHVQHLLDDLAGPSKDWKQELEEFVTEVCADDYSWRRPNRMFVCNDVYLPGKCSDGQMGALVAIFDTSGSVSNDELRVYFGDLCAAVAAVKPTAVYVVYVDAAVSNVEQFDNPTEAEIRNIARRDGGGGTDMRVGLNWVDDNVDDVTACIVFTDGDTPFGEQRQYPVLWAISGSAVAPWGRTLTLPSTVQ